MSRFPVFRGVVELNFAARTLFGGIYDAGIKRARIHVQAHGALIKFAGIEDPVDGLAWVDSAGLKRVHFYGSRGFNGAMAGPDILIDNVEVLHQQTADGDGHPAVLIAVVVNGATLADFPTDGDQLV